MNVSLLVSLLWFLIALALAASSLRDGRTVQALSWAVVAAIAVWFSVRAYRHAGRVQV
ncbi:hypothetical protein [Salinigranum sp. GCM10025319]|uniref:hypothetical protein n=1 Tax=Salinigranum sp. GCM10025319 TaxID=3252687 RepID=UPI003619F639